MHTLAISFLLSTVANTAMLWVLQTRFPEILHVSDRWTSVLLVGVLIAALNMLVRPILNILALPLRLFAGILAAIVVNGIIFQLLTMVVAKLGIPDVALTVGGGIVGWLVIVIALGLANWVTRLISK